MDSKRSLRTEDRTKIRDWVVSPSGKSFRFVSFLPCVRACVRAVWLLSGTPIQNSTPALSLFPSGFSSFSSFLV